MHANVSPWQFAGMQNELPPGSNGDACEAVANAKNCQNNRQLLPGHRLDDERITGDDLLPQRRHEIRHAHKEKALFSSSASFAGQIVAGCIENSWTAEMVGLSNGNYISLWQP